MRLAAIASIIVAAFLLSCYELGIRATQGKEKTAFVVITVLTMGLSIGLVLYPDTPGPNELLQVMYGWLGELIVE